MGKEMSFSKSWQLFSVIVLATLFCSGLAAPIAQEAEIIPDEPIEPVEPAEKIEPIIEDTAVEAETNELIEPAEVTEPVEPAETKETIEPAETIEPVEPVKTIESVEEPAKETEPILEDIVLENEVIETVLESVEPVEESV